MTTSHDATSDPTTTAASRTDSAGARLGRAREDLRLTREEVAGRLHLSVRQIRAIEEDNYAELPGPTYVRGYLKSYALLVGLAPEPVLEAYTRRITQPMTPDFSAIAPQKEITSQHHQVRFVTYVVLAIVIGLAFAWWQGRETGTLHPLLEVPGEPVAADGEGVATEPVVPVAEPAAPAPGAPAAAVAPATPAPAAAPVAVAVEPAVSAAGGARVRLVLTVEQDSWVDVRDARQVKLLYETVPGGRTVALEGVAPVSVFLGNAAGVRVEYNGRSVDVARHQRGMVARFTLDEAPAP